MNPYEKLPSKAFWKPAIANRSMFDVEDLWDPKFKIRPADKIVTYGSCFAQHIGRALESRGFQWFRPEAAPTGLSAANAKKFNYGIFSTRTGNVYTTSLLRQWAEWALTDATPPDEVWEKDGRYYDPFRPRIEPNGFSSKEEVFKSRDVTLRAFRTGVENANFFVFTLGLTESWFNSVHDYEYPMCPGTVAGDFDEEQHSFKNQQFNDVLINLSQAIELLRSVNPTLRFLLTVSPVPLTATMSSQHVAVATMASKSLLRAVAGQLSTNRAYVDYFPSYEIISSPVFKGSFFEPNQREVNPTGVNFVMDKFFQSQTKKFGIQASGGTQGLPSDKAADVVCEEELLGAFQSG